MRFFGLLLLALAVACGDNNDGSKNTNGGDSDTVLNSVTQTIGAAGGTVTGYYGAQVPVPAGAVTSDMDTTGARDDTGAPAITDNSRVTLGGVIALLPHGATFQAPVSIRIPFDSTHLPDGATPTIYQAEQGGSFAAIPTTIDGNFAVVSVTSFFLGRRRHRQRACPGGGPPASPTPPSGDISIQAFRVDGATAQVLGSVSTSLPGPRPTSIVVHPSGRFVYISYSGSAAVNSIPPRSIGVYAFDRFSGTLSATAISSIALGDPDASDPVVPVVHPSGHFLYVVNYNRQTTGSITRLTIDGVTGALSDPQAVAAVDTITATAVVFSRGGGRAYVSYTTTSGTSGDATDYNHVKIYGVDLNSGLFGDATASVPAVNEPWSMVVSRNGKNLYVAGAGSDSVRSFTIATGGGVAQIGTDATLPAEAEPTSIAALPSGNFLVLGQEMPWSDVNVHVLDIQANGSVVIGASARCARAAVALVRFPLWQTLPKTLLGASMLKAGFLGTSSAAMAASPKHKTDPRSSTPLALARATRSCLASLAPARRLSTTAPSIAYARSMATPQMTHQAQSPRPSFSSPQAAPLSPARQPA